MRFAAGALLFACAAAAQTGKPSEEFQTSAGTVKITPVQHASLYIEAGGQVIYIDPAQGNYDDLPKADMVLITDIHGDHMSPKVLSVVRKAGAPVIAPAEVAKTVQDATVIRNGETKTFGRWTIEAVPMYNLQRGPEPGKVFHEKGRGNGYILTYGGKRFYFAGDTEVTPEMRGLRNIDVAFVPMNLPYTMPPDEAAEGVRAFKPKIVYPYHYRGADLSVFEKALAGTGIDVRIRNWY